MVTPTIRSTSATTSPPMRAMLAARVLDGTVLVLQGSVGLGSGGGPGRSPPAVVFPRLPTGVHRHASVVRHMSDRSVGPDQIERLGAAHPDAVRVRQPCGEDEVAVGRHVVAGIAAQLCHAAGT